MKTIVAILMILISFSGFSQAGNNQIGIGLDLGLPIGDFGEYSNIGFGATAKGLYGVGDAGQIGLTVGYLHFGAEESNSSFEASTGIVPILAGYRHHLGQIYLEPQLGISIISSEVSINAGQYGQVGGSSSTTAFGWAVGAGYLINDFDLSARYQSASKDGGSLGFFAVRLGYNFTL